MHLKYAIVFTVLITGISFSASAERHKDPLEWWNKPVFVLNDYLDTFFLRPVARTYQFILPGQVERGVANFFQNLSEPVSSVNALIQAKPGESGIHLGRFGINSTLGVLGFFDVAAIWNIDAPDEDFDQSLAVWGVPSGPYLVMPLLGPGTLRSWLAEPFDLQFEVLTYYPESTQGQLGLRALNLVSDRAGLLQYESIVSGDRYQAIKDLYEQTREYEIKDGQVTDEFSAESDSDDGEFVDESF